MSWCRIVKGGAVPGRMKRGRARLPSDPAQNLLSMVPASAGWCRAFARPEDHRMDTSSDQVTGKARGATPKHRGAKVSGSAKRQGTRTVRCQMHLSETVSKRLAVHAALVGRNQSRVADEVLLSWLARFGKGRELFPALDLGESDVAVDSAA